ncbi:MAG: InlB B-repeat-containing protein [Clostridia bacterium]
MKSKKLISLLCAAAMSASAFAGLTVTASAATPVYTFDGSDITGFSGNGTLAQVSDDKGEYFSIKANGSSTYSATLTLPADAQLTSADGYTIEYDARLHKSNGMGRYGRYTQVAFIDSSNAAKDSRDYGPYGALFSGGNSSTETGQGYTAGVASSLSARYQLDGTIVNDPGTETLAADNTSVTGIADDMWVRVQTYVKGDVAKVTVIDVNNNKIVDGVDYINSATKLDTIYVTAGRGDDSVTGPGEVCLDNIKIYSGEAETLTTDGLRGVVAAATPIPEPETVSGSAQTLAAPASVTDAYTADFNNAAVGTVASIETEDQDAKTVVDGMKVKVGSRSTGADTKTYAAIAKVATGDNALKLAANQFSTNGRGPVVTLDDTKEISSGETAIMGFTTYLSAAKGTDEGGLPRLFLIDNTTNIDGNGCARDILAVITTEDASGYTNGDTPIGIQVTEGWHTVVVAVSEGTYRVFIDGKYKDDEGKLSPAVKGTKVGSGSTSAQVTHLPSFAVENTKSDSGTAYSKALIDNVVAYKITDTLDAKYLPTETAAPTPAPIPAKVTMSVDETANTVTLTSDKDTDAVLVQASYRTDKTLDSVKKVVNVTLTAGKAYTVPATDLAKFTKNDKIMVWDSLKTMTPLASAYTVKNGDAQATAKPAPTAEPTETPTEAPTEAPAETPATTVAPTAEPTEAPAETAAPTDTPAPTATAVPTYAVSGTVDAGVKSVTLTDKAEAENTIAGTIEDTAVTFTGVKAGTYTVSAVAKDDYKDLTVTPQEITVSGNLAGVFTVKTTAKVKSAVTTTVTGGTATVTGATDLTSVAEGTELTITATTPALGYLAANPTITVTKTGDADTTVTVTEGKFTMPAYPVTVTVAYAADPTVAIATLENTATSGWGSNTAAATVNTESGLEHFNNDTDISWAGTAFAQFTLPTLADGEGVAKAELIYNVKQGGNRSRTSKIFALTNGDIDLTTMTGAAADRFADARTLITSFNTVVGENALTTDVTAAAQGKNGKITLMFTDNAGGADLYGKASADKAPVLKITKGKVVTFNVAAAANADTKVAGAKIVVKNGDTTVATITTNDEGVASTALSAGTYTYTVESNDYAIKKDGTLTVADSVVAENVALSANAATTVEIANPATGTTLAQGEEATYTATVKDQDGRVMTAAVDWAVVNGEDAAAENITVANGKVNVAEEATTGDYKVKATVNGTTVSATADLKVIAAEKLNLSITSQDADQGTVAYTVNGVTSTDTQLNKGKKIVATATPAALYEFVGWVTSTENLITGTYVSTDAQYSFDLNANTTLIAVFKYTGIYYQNDYNNATESDWVSGNTGRYTVSIAGDDDKYTDVSAISGGSNGTTISSNAVQVDADKDYVLEFDLALTGGNNQTSAFAVKSKTSKKYPLVLQLKTANTTTWTVNGTTEVTLEKGVFYHYTIEKVETGVKVTIAPTAGGDAVVDGVTYANDTDTASSEFAGTISNAGLAGMQFNTKRMYAGMKIDNVLVKAPATTSVTE